MYPIDSTKLLEIHELNGWMPNMGKHIQSSGKTPLEFYGAIGAGTHGMYEGIPVSFYETDSTQYVSVWVVEALMVVHYPNKTMVVVIGGMTSTWRKHPESLWIHLVNKIRNQY